VDANRFHFLQIGPFHLVSSLTAPGLLDFSRYNLPKWENKPNDHRMHQNGHKNTKWPLYRPNGHNICKHLPLKHPMYKIYPNWFENKPSGNPGLRRLFGQIRRLQKNPE
jgi:hypothetical protein